METALPPSPLTAGQPVKRVVVARGPAMPRTKKPRAAKRLFLVFLLLFLWVVLMMVSGGN